MLSARSRTCVRMCAPVWRARCARAQKHAAAPSQAASPLPGLQRAPLPHHKPRPQINQPTCATAACSWSTPSRNSASLSCSIPMRCSNVASWSCRSLYASFDRPYWPSCVCAQEDSDAGDKGGGRVAERLGCCNGTGAWRLDAGCTSGEVLHHLAARVAVPGRARRPPRCAGLVRWCKRHTGLKLGMLFHVHAGSGCRQHPDPDAPTSFW